MVEHARRSGLVQSDRARGRRQFGSKKLKHECARRGATRYRPSRTVPDIERRWLGVSNRFSEQASTGLIRDLYRLGFDASWEMTSSVAYAARLRRRKASSKRVKPINDVLVTLLAEVALNYSEARTLQTQLSGGR
jgi:hypothetical protein